MTFSWKKQRNLIFRDVFTRHIRVSVYKEVPENFHTTILWNLGNL